jgi:hypothetical protein
MRNIKLWTALLNGRETSDASKTILEIALNLCDEQYMLCWNPNIKYKLKSLKQPFIPPLK